jgi:tetratricopeptide (TPR) repeat protein
MMRPSILLRRDALFYPLLFAAWAGCIWLFNATYSYFGTPFPGVSLGTQAPAATMKSMTDALSSQARSLATEKNSVLRRGLLEARGSTFLQMYGFARKPEYLDSAAASAGRALAEKPAASSVYFLLGRIMNEKKDFARAKTFLEKAVELDRRSVSANHMLGILLWYNLKQPEAAKPYFENILAVDSAFPTINYMLGEISLEKNDPTAAVRYYEKEVKCFLSIESSRKPQAVNPSDIRMAGLFSSHRLSFLYSTTFIDAQKAQDRFNLYLRLETDPQRRQSSINEIQKYWKTGQQAVGSK